MTSSDLLQLGNFFWLNKIDMYKSGYGGTYITLNEIIGYNCYSNGYISFKDIYNNYWLEYEESVSGAFRYTLDFDNLPIEQCQLSFEDGALINSINISLVDYNGTNVANVEISENNFYNINLDTIESDYPNNNSLDNLFIDTITTYWTTPYSANYEMYVYNRFSYETAWFNIGYTEGYDIATSQLQPQIETNYNNGYQVGYNVGYQVGYNENAEVNLASPVLAVADAPLTIFKNIFDVDILGFNVASACFGICGLMLVVWLIKKFFGGGE